MDDTHSQKSASNLEKNAMTELSLRPPLTGNRIQNNVPTPLLFRMYISSQVLRLSTETRFTACVLVHRYAQTAPTEETDWPWVAAVCLFLACKQEDEPRRLRDIINVHQMVLSVEKNDTAVVVLQKEPPPLNSAYWELKQTAIATEQFVLRWLHFDCFVSHPHRAVVCILEKLGSTNKATHDDLVQLSCRRLNDALFYPRALRYGVLEMACAAIDLVVTEQQKLQSTFQHEWWTKCGVSDEKFQECRKELQKATENLKSMAQD